MIHSALARKHSLGENQEIWTKFRRCSGHDNSRTCREFRFSMRAKNRAIKFSPLLPLENLFRKLSRCFRSRQNYRKFPTAKTFEPFYISFFFFPASPNGWMIVEMDWRAILIDSISKNILSLSLSFHDNWKRERELLNKLEVESARSMSIRWGNRCPSISDFYSPADLSMRFEEVIVGWARGGEERGRGEGDVGGKSVEFNVGSEMEQRCLRGLRRLMAELLRFDHLYLVASISIEKEERKGGSLIISDSSSSCSSVILLVYGKFEFIFSLSLLFLYNVRDGIISFDGNFFEIYLYLFPLFKVSAFFSISFEI